MLEKEKLKLHKDADILFEMGFSQYLRNADSKIGNTTETEDVIQPPSDSDVWYATDANIEKYHRMENKTKYSAFCLECKQVIETFSLIYEQYYVKNLNYKEPWFLNEMTKSFILHFTGVKDSIWVMVCETQKQIHFWVFSTEPFSKRRHESKRKLKSWGKQN